MSELIAAPQPLITKYRPADFEQVVGNELAVNSLVDTLLSDSCPHAFLLTGPPGLGKTSLARIIGTTVQATVSEFDIASNAGVDDVRQLVELSSFQPVISGASRMYIMDECHVYSKTAWQALLKLIEEPPPWLYFGLCTTELAKVPESIRTRCFHVALKPIKVQEMDDYLTAIASLEGWTVQSDVQAAIVQAAQGLPRKGLTLLQAGHAMQTREQLSQVIAEVEFESSSLTELCRYLLKGGTDWGWIQTRLAEVNEEDSAFEGMTRYLYSAMVKSDEGGARRAWQLLEAFTFPRSSVDRKALLATVIGSLLWAGG